MSIVSFKRSLLVHPSTKLLFSTQGLLCADHLRYRNLEQALIVFKPTIESSQNVRTQYLQFKIIFIDNYCASVLISKKTSVHRFIPLQRDIKTSYSAIQKVCQVKQRKSGLFSFASQKSFSRFLKKWVPIYQRSIEEKNIILLLSQIRFTELKLSKKMGRQSISVCFVKSASVRN